MIMKIEEGKKRKIEKKNRVGKKRKQIKIP